MMSPELAHVIRTASVSLDAILRVPANPRCLVVFAHGAGSDRKSPRNVMAAQALDAAGCATLLFDLLTPAEKQEYGANVFDIGKLTERLDGVVRWAREQSELQGVKVALLGASTGAAAALNVAARLGTEVCAVVSRGGRPDLADQSSLASVVAPTLFVIGGDDGEVLEASRPPFERVAGEKFLRIVPGATHLFDEPGTLEDATDAAVTWIVRHC